MKMASEQLNPVAMVAREIKASSLNFKQIAKHLDRDPASVQWMLNRDNMSVERLVVCSKALNYNFFLEIGYMLHRPGPSDMKGNPLNTKVNALNTQLQAKETRIAELEKKLTETEIQMKKIESEADIKHRLLETELNTLKQVMKDILSSRQV